MPTLHEQCRSYVDDRATLRCDHTIRFLGLSVLRLHFRIEPVSAHAAAQTSPPPS